MHKGIYRNVYMYDSFYYTIYISLSYIYQYFYISTQVCMRVFICTCAHTNTLKSLRTYTNICGDECMCVCSVWESMSVCIFGSLVWIRSLMQWNDCMKLRVKSWEHQAFDFLITQLSNTSYYIQPKIRTSCFSFFLYTFSFVFSVKSLFWYGTQH